MQYLGEHLLPGRLGHFFALLSFAASFVAVIAYFKATQAKLPEEQNSWRRMGRTAFYIDVAAVFAVLFTILYIVSSRLFEYNFAWEHSSKALKFQYLLACVWEAQEGSFLLWNLWVCVLGLILIRKADKWESPVMTVMSFTQFCIATMIMGIYLFGNKIGLNPFILVRQTEFGMRAPIFSQPDYLSIPQMQDGQGLNALLQNYWMVIHPPVLFLGYSSTVVPFAYAIAGLWKRDFGGWTRAALPWTIFSACVLGTGIMMGSAWAYEALSFGGYWGWDPVENASLVPWLVMVAGLHTQVIYNATGHSLRSTYFFLITQFVLVLYSTFLTRSGILGDLSVHAFVDSGMNVQLASFVLVFLLPAYALFIARYKQIPHIVKEEATDSREFWMFIGSLILFLSAAYIIIFTSLPVINLVREKKVNTDDALFTYNRIEIFIAILIGIFTAFAQYLKYKGTGKGVLMKKLWLPTAVALVVSTLVSIFGGIHYDKYGAGFLAAIHLALFAAVYTVVANAEYIRVGLKGNLRAAGGSVAHIGFGLMLVGILISSSRKQVLSYNTAGVTFSNPDPKQDPLENLTLVKGVRTEMNKYWATYLGNDSLDERSQTRYFHIHFQDKQTADQFDLYPNMMKNTKGQEGGSPNPDKFHYWNRDIFTYISALPPDDNQDTAQFLPQALKLKDTAFYSKGYIILDSVVKDPNNDKYHFSPNDTALMASLTVVSRDSMRYKASPVIFIKDNQPHFLTDTVFAQDLALRFNKITTDQRIELGIKESSEMVPFIALKVLEFPQINILWIGTIIMITGFVMSLLWRRRQAKAKMSVR
ncbi:cytochrome c biogenesis protein CcsA [Puia dinghuensis]|uniref:Cytochrome c assembly protein n=1 Tax=Puia dinghuensis TaxID=1792502 RepID=A0A8J2UC51_9BACT|nr:cytochrome c biogenesis protein CcsA [Puia dinghuensis]GGA96693.1 cytochrome c assembly protein [Puia dinghuensis]